MLWECERLASAREKGLFMRIPEPTHTIIFFKHPPVRIGKIHKEREKEKEKKEGKDSGKEKEKKKNKELVITNLQDLQR
mgnify:CR=1 FL=1